MPKFATSYIPTGGASLSRNADVLNWSPPARPQALSLYIRFRDLGTSTVGAPIAWFGSSDPTADPRLVLDAASTGYRLTHDNGTVSVAAQTGSLAGRGSMVELLGTLSASGQVRVIQSLNNGTATQSTQTSGIGMAQAWTAAKLWVNSSGFLGLRNLTVARGVQSLVTMRRLAKR